MKLKNYYDNTALSSEVKEVDNKNWRKKKSFEKMYYLKQKKIFNKIYFYMNLINKIIY